MGCIKAIVKYSYLIVFIVIITGCESIQLGKKQTSAESEEALSVDTQNIPFNVIPSPYDTAIPVPEQAAREFALAKSQMAQEKWKEAESTLLLMTETYPGLSGVYVNLGIIYRNLASYEQAIKALAFAIEKNAANMDAYSQLGLLYREQGDFKKAEQTYLNALAVWPHDPNALLGLGVLYELYMGELALAYEQYILLDKVRGSSDKKLKGWLIDIKSRLPKEQKVKKPVKKEATKKEADVPPQTTESSATNELNP